MENNRRSNSSMRSPAISRLGAKPTSGTLGWAVAAVLALTFVFSRSSCPQIISGSAPLSSSSTASNPQGNHRLPRNSGDSRLDQVGQGNGGLSGRTRRFFVVGCGHSGTSLLLRTIGNMPGVRCIQRETALFHKNTEGDLRLKNVLADWDRIARRGNFSAWVEKTPRHVHYISKILEMDSEPGNTRVIFLHRDGRDVATSFRARGYSWTKAVGRWVDDNSAVIPYLDGGDVLPVGFEELTSASAVLCTLRKVAGFLELGVTDEQLALALMPGMQPHEYQEYCTAYRNDEEKAADLAASLVTVMAGKGAPRQQGEFEKEEEDSDASLSVEGGSKLEKHNAFRTWQMSQAWAEVPRVTTRDWSEDMRLEFHENEAAVELMRKFGYSLEDVQAR